MMLITVSGMVGSGKSTAAKRVVEQLAASGIDAQYVRFRSLGLFFTRRPAPVRLPRTDRPVAADASPRWQGFRARPLSAVVAIGYAARILAFRLFGPRRSSETCLVCDRYFYDHFVHYEMRTRRERYYAAWLRQLVPVPDVALVLVAGADTIARRRPDYDREYVALASRGYERLTEQFPELIAIRTDTERAGLDAIDDVIRRRLAADQRIATKNVV